MVAEDNGQPCVAAVAAWVEEVIVACLDLAKEGPGLLVEMDGVGHLEVTKGVGPVTEGDYRVVAVVGLSLVVVVVAHQSRADPVRQT